MIDFEAMTEMPIEHFRDGDGTVYFRKVEGDALNLLRGRLPAGSSIGLHRHEGTSEVIYILSGVGTILHEGKTERLTAGSCHYCAEGESHSLRNDGDEDLTFFAVIPKHM